MKKNKKESGFTLIELLAVITIMGILMMVAIPSISNTINNSRKDTYVSTAGEILNSIKNYVNTDSITYTIGTKTTPILSYGSSKIFNLTLTPDVLNEIVDGGAKSPFGGNELYGWVTLSFDYEAQKVDYYIYLTDKKNCIYNSSAKTLGVKKEELSRSYVVRDPKICGKYDSPSQFDGNYLNYSVRLS